MKSRFIKPTDIIQLLPKEHPLNKCSLKSFIFDTSNCILIKKPENEEERHSFVETYLINNLNTLISFSIPKEVTTDTEGDFLNYYKFFYKNLLKKDNEPLVSLVSPNFFIKEEISCADNKEKFISSIESKDLEIFYDSKERRYTINILIDNSFIGFVGNLKFPL